jgi:hypothetical protein
MRGSTDAGATAEQSWAKRAGRAHVGMRLVLGAAAAALVAHAGAGNAGAEPIRGMTIGPIESSLHPGKGYGTEAYGRTLDEQLRWGTTWVSLTPFGRTYDLCPSGIDMSFEAPFEENRDAVRRGIRMAHARGLRVLLVPHLWVETGGWRAEIDPGSEEGWARWAVQYAGFVVSWAKVAEEERAEMLSVGVELRSWVTTGRAATFREVIRRVREVYHGPITYSANWDDVEDTLILGDVDVIGVNAFYPLTDKENATFEELLGGGRKVAEQVQRLSRLWHRPVLFTEIGYTTRPDPALRPWEWPDKMRFVKVDQEAQALAYRALLAPLLDVPEFLGFFVWRVYADPDDQSQEDEWGFSPRGKLSETVVRDAFGAYWAADGPEEIGDVLVRLGN